MFSDQQRSSAATLIDDLRKRQLTLATAESCTGGLLGALLSDIPGASDVLDRGFITYSNAAKTELLGVPAETIEQCGAVSAVVAKAMALGALSYSHASLAVSITGIAGPGGGSADKPVGLVFLAVARLGAEPLQEKCLWGDIGRAAVRNRALDAALALIRKSLT